MKYKRKIVKRISDYSDCHPKNLQDNSTDPSDTIYTISDDTSIFIDIADPCYYEYNNISHNYGMVRKSSYMSRYYYKKEDGISNLFLYKKITSKNFK